MLVARFIESGLANGPSRKSIKSVKHGHLLGFAAAHYSAFEGVLWVLRSGARWRALPESFPSPSTCWRRLVDWENDDVPVRIWQAFLDTL